MPCDGMVSSGVTKLPFTHTFPLRMDRSVGLRIRIELSSRSTSAVRLSVSTACGGIVLRAAKAAYCAFVGPSALLNAEHPHNPMAKLAITNFGNMSRTPFENVSPHWDSTL